MDLAMIRIAASELVRNFSEYSDVALKEAVIVTRNGRDRLVLLNVTEYDYLRHAAARSEDFSSERGTRDEKSRPKRQVRSRRKAR